LEKDTIKGKKLTAAQPIKLGDLVLTYEGVLTKDSGKIDLEKGGNYSMYVKFNQQNWKLDAGKTPNPRFGYGRYINNDSAKPNLTWKVAPNPVNPAVPFVYFVAKKDIAKGDELQFDYFQGTKPTAAERAAFPWL
jgi:SET domain-containing protein